ncbi:metal ABC transporter permease, partial [Glaesserella parasuis]|nr:metal ABC transporter permease [Glaesserella parasuis]
VSLFFLVIYWKDLLLVFFDEIQAKAVGISPMRLKVLFFSLLSACIVAALQSVGAILVIAMVVTPGATAYLLTDKFGKLLIIAISLGGFSGFFGAYL